MGGSLPRRGTEAVDIEIALRWQLSRSADDLAEAGAWVMEARKAGHRVEEARALHWMFWFAREAVRDLEVLEQVKALHREAAGAVGWRTPGRPDVDHFAGVSELELVTDAPRPRASAN